MDNDSSFCDKAYERKVLCHVDDKKAKSGSLEPISGFISLLCLVVVPGLDTWCAAPATPHGGARGSWTVGNCVTLSSSSNYRGKLMMNRCPSRYSKPKLGVDGTPSSRRVPYVPFRDFCVRLYQSLPPFYFGHVDNRVVGGRQLRSILSAASRRTFSLCPTSGNKESS